MGVVNKSPESLLQPDKGCRAPDPRNTLFGGQCCHPVHTATCWEGISARKKLGSRLEGQVSAPRAFLPLPITGANFKVSWNKERPESSREFRVDL